MSEVIEAIVVRQPTQVVANVLKCCEEIPDSKSLHVLPLDDASLIYRKITNRRSFGNDANVLAALLSDRLSQSLLFRYDSGTCFRYSAVFVRNKLTEEYTLDDELWVELDEEGDPDPSRGVLTIDKLKKGVEYETQKNAVQLGLDAIGVKNWKGLLQQLSQL